MEGMRMRWFTCICLLVLSVSCTPHAELEKAKAEKPQERTISRDEAIGELPCFKCHSYQRFSSPEKGAFSHTVHLNTGYHCNQCHSFRAHRFMKTDTSVCNKCHNIKTFTYAASGFPARFNHEFHAKLGCKECHPGIFQMKRGTTKMTMDAIYQGRQCGACHNGTKAFPSSECGRCHEMKVFKQPVSYKVGGIGSVTFSHEFHTQIFQCDQCHPGTFAMKRSRGKMKMDDMYAGKLCGACHNGEKAFASTDCEKCHIH
jgi:c(7)-type cytochrome triheme protein